MNNPEIAEQIKNLNLEELEACRRGAKFSSRIFDVLGISFLFLILIVDSTLFLVVGSVIVYILAHACAHLGHVVSLVEDRLLKYSDK